VLPERIYEENRKNVNERLFWDGKEITIFVNFLEDQGKKGQDVSLNNFLVCILKDGQQILGARREREGRKMGFRENCKKTIDFFHQKWNIITWGILKVLSSIHVHIQRIKVNLLKCSLLGIFV
jgi:hypothetical protein